MKVLSLFDGMACGYLAMQDAGIKVDSYDAFEIDETAIKTAVHNFPDIIEHGDVFEGDFTKFKGYDILIGGSPCTYWSIAAAGQGQRETEPAGIGWELFSQYVRALRQAKPKYFLYENNASMHKNIKQTIIDTFGFEPIMIDSSLVSAQSRKRLYWVGELNSETGLYFPVDVKQPKERGITMRDVIDNGNVSYVEKGHTNVAFHPHQVGLYPKQNGMQTKSQGYRIYDTRSKGVTICGQGGGLGAKTGLYAIKGKTFEVKDKQIRFGDKAYKIDLPDGSYDIRRLTVTETKRMQTVPDWYEFPTSNTQAYKMLGNGWTVAVISHILNAIKERDL